jgi:hypothetical protein
MKSREEMKLKEILACFTNFDWEDLDDLSEKTGIPTRVLGRRLGVLKHLGLVTNMVREGRRQGGRRVSMSLWRKVAEGESTLTKQEEKA